MRIRQLVFVSEERDKLASQICNLLDLKETYHDAGLINFGLENVLIPLNDTFFEIVMPVQKNTTAERFLKKRNGEGGYMVIVDVECFEKEEERINSSDIEIVWQGDRREEEIRARTIHLHPKQVGGAILSLDKMEPANAWLWAGTNWEKDINLKLVDCLSGVIMQSDNPSNLCSKWEKALGVKRSSSDEITIQLDRSKIIFVDDTDGRGEGVSAFIVKSFNKEKSIENALDMEVMQNNEISLGGVKIILE